MLTDLVFFDYKALAQAKSSNGLSHSTSTVSAAPLPAPPIQVHPAPANTDLSPATANVIEQLETVTFGFTKPGLTIHQRLNELEDTIFHQTFPHDSLSARTQKLEKTLLGEVTTPSSNESTSQGKSPDLVFSENQLNPAFTAEEEPLKPKPPAEPPLWHEPAYQVELPEQELTQFALQLVNDERSQLGLMPLTWDADLSQLAKHQIEDLKKRNKVSHLNSNGENPDKRYTENGGTDALIEGLVAINGTLATKSNRHMIAKVIQTLKEHQDDRDALLSPDATSFAFSYGAIPDKERLIAITEVVTKHAIMHPLPKEVKVGQKIDVKGVVLKPYKFQRVTVAWEGLNPESIDLQDDSDEPMPYFPPLDFVAYGQKSEHDWERGKAILRTAGVLAAIAGGMFIPPVALAAPLIAMSGTTQEIKAAQDIPIRGGIKVDGSIFTGTIPLDNSGKSGMYYVTVWASSEMDTRPVPISRRTIIAKADKDISTSDQRQNKPERGKKSNQNVH